MEFASEHKELHSKLEDTLAALPVGIIAVDKHGIIVVCNSESERIFGGSLLHKHVDELVPEASRAQHHGLMQSYHANSQPRRMGQNNDIYGVKLDGTKVPLVIGLNPCHVGGVDYVLASVADISLQRQYESQLSTSNQELLNFAYITSHDLKAPLTTIKGLAAAIDQDLEAGRLDELKSNVNHIQTIAGQLEKLIFDILKRSKAEYMQSQAASVDFQKLCHELFDNLRGLSHQNGVEMRQSIEAVQLVGHRLRLYEVLENLLSNSLKYSNPNREQRFTELRVMDAGDRVRLEVEDNGLGIPQDKHAEVFQMFKRFHAGRSQGSGLGMAIVKKHVEHMKGSISFESTPAGTVFRVEIPKVTQRDDSVTAPRLRAPSSSD